MANSEVVNVSEYEELAKQKLPKMVYDYYASGAEDQWTLKENRSAFERIRSVCSLRLQCRAALSHSQLG